MPSLLSRPPERLHHHAYVVKDQEKNRQFFEDTLGIPLTATWCEQHFSPWVNRDVAFCHTFYSLGDGGALAFFSFADDEVYRKCQPEKPAEIAAFDHIAFKVDDATYDELIARINAAGETVRETDHGYCRSIYCTSPDGLIVEFTVDSPDVAKIDAVRRTDAHSELARWMAGDHRTNNDLRSHLAT
ncbi:MAG TPA: VOC family protein [Acetobacteraceae bacterium]|jgi:glyoxylase I family protein|nr:VOC family protein [Acetobacteraceae bacterium]